MREAQKHGINFGLSHAYMLPMCKMCVIYASMKTAGSCWVEKGKQTRPAGPKKLASERPVYFFGTETDSAHG